ncbi:MAG: right-handed parallel beta-helix repeat-containing protein, partial [Thermoplasmata archaeon]|nr:right-handed parallel beta-helix repeat-containing protein [Thermoplasmata archaeon]
MGSRDVTGPQAIHLARTWMLLLPIALLVGLALTAFSSAQTPPPGSGEWIVQDETDLEGIDIELDGWLHVRPWASLTLSNLTLTMNGTFDGELGINVSQNGSLYLSNVYIRSSDTDIHYWFICRGPVVIESCDIRDVAANDEYYGYYDRIVGGVQIFDSASILRDTVFHDCQRIAVYVSWAAPTIEGCKFEDTEYVRTVEDPDVYDYRLGTYTDLHVTDATGLYLFHADPVVRNCTFQSNGNSSTALLFYNASYHHNTIVTLGRGALCYASSPTFEDCYFTANGLQPEDREIDGVVQAFTDLMLGEYVYQGGLVYTSHNDLSTVRDCRFLYNDGHGIFGHLGFPETIERCHFEGNSFLRNNRTQGPSGSVYIIGELGTGGNMSLIDCTFTTNWVQANVYVIIVNVTIVNCSSRDMGVGSRYDVFVSSPRVTLKDTQLIGSSNATIILYVGYPYGRTRVWIENCTIVGGFYTISVMGSEHVDITVYNSSIYGFRHAAAYVVRTEMDLVNCNITPLEFRSADEENSTSNIHISYFVDLKVTWQNGVPIQGALVLALNRTEVLKRIAVTDKHGRTGLLVLPSITYEYNTYIPIEMNHNPYLVQVFNAGQVTNQSLVVMSNTEAHLVLVDHEEPVPYITRPFPGQAHGEPRVDFRGFSHDLLSGMSQVFVSADNVTWTEAGTNAWNVTLDLPEGEHTLYVRAVDVAGNEAWASVGSVVVDLTPPHIQLVGADGGVYHTNVEDFIFGFNTERFGSVFVNGRLLIQGDLPDTVMVPVHLPERGSTYISIQVVDRAGHSNYTRVFVCHDIVPPVIHLEMPFNLTNSSTVHIGGWVDDENLAGVRIMDEDYPNATLNHTLHLTDGKHLIEVAAWDKANNMVTVVWELEVDTRPPTLRLEGPREGSVVTRAEVIIGVMTDEPVICVWVDDFIADPDGARHIRSIVLEEGENTIRVKGMDLAGNVRSGTLNLTLDTIPPQITVDTPSDGYLAKNSTIIVSGMVTDSEQFWVDGRMYPGQGDFEVVVSLTETSPQGRCNIVLVEAEDEAGNTAEVVL